MYTNLQEVRGASSFNKGKDEIFNDFYVHYELIPVQFLFNKQHEM